MGGIEEGDTVVVFDAGPVGIFAAKSAWLMGAGRVIVVDHLEYRLEFLKRFAQCEVIDFKEVDDMAIHIKKVTDWLGADRVDVGEGLLSDLAHGHLPNIFGEMGARAEWRYNRAGFVKKAVVVSAAVALAVYLARRRRDSVSS